MWVSIECPNRHSPPPSRHRVPAHTPCLLLCCFLRMPPFTHSAAGQHGGLAQGPGGRHQPERGSHPAIAPPFLSTHGPLHPTPQPLLWQPLNPSLTYPGPALLTDNSSCRGRRLTGASGRGGAAAVQVQLPCRSKPGSAGCWGSGQLWHLEQQHHPGRQVQRCQHARRARGRDGVRPQGQHDDGGRSSPEPACCSAGGPGRIPGWIPGWGSKPCARRWSSSSGRQQPGTHPSATGKHQYQPFLCCIRQPSQVIAQLTPEFARIYVFHGTP